MAAVISPDLFGPYLPPPRFVGPRLVPPALVRPAPPAGVRLPRRHSARVYRRRRIVVLVALTLVVVAAALAVQAAVGRRAEVVVAPSRPIAAHVWVVRTGDTLWSIALASGATGDIRPLVDELSDEVHGQPLQVGERIELP